MTFGLCHIIKGCRQELLTDMVLDKLIGDLSILGISANMISAKAMTWRLGLLFGMLSARGEEIGINSVLMAVRLIRLLFKNPSVVTVKKLLSVVENTDIKTFS